MRGNKRVLCLQSFSSTCTWPVEAGEVVAIYPEYQARVGEEKGEAACFIMSMCPKKKPHLIGENDGIKNFTLRWNHVQVGIR